MIEGSVSPSGVGIHVVLCGPSEDSVASKVQDTGKSSSARHETASSERGLLEELDCDSNQRIMLINYFAIESMTHGQFKRQINGCIIFVEGIFEGAYMRQRVRTQASLVSLSVHSSGTGFPTCYTCLGVGY